MLIFASLALADIPPPPGEKRAQYQLEIQGVPKGQRLVVYPWSLSNGTPQAHATVLENGKPLDFGRRIAGIPRLYLVPDTAWEAYQQSKDGQALVSASTLCSHRPNQVFIVPRGAPDKVVEHLRATKVEPGTCTLEPVKEEKSGCQTSPASVFWWAPFLMLAARRR